MLTAEENERLTRVGPGTPGGELMRRYWHPVAATQQLEENPVRKVRILGEDLVLYRDRGGRMGLIGDRCLHRAMHLEFGVPEEEGLRCPYHGWLYDADGKCIQQPLEPPDSTFKDKMQLKAYPVEEMGGLIWAYLGPQPAPLLPRWDLFVREDGFRHIVSHQLPCNWLQVMENRGDRTHGVYLHGRLFQYVLERQGKLTDDPQARYNAAMRAQQSRLDRGAYVQLRPIWNEYGFTKANKDSDAAGEGDPIWEQGFHPVFFPYILGDDGDGGIRHTYQIGVPVDDTHTWHISYFCYVFPEGVQAPSQQAIPYAEVPLKDENGDYILDYVLSQDMVAWYAQGGITDRAIEHLGVTDTIIIAYRKLLSEQIQLVQDGGEPMNVFRDHSKNVRLGTVDGGHGRRLSGFGTQFYRENYHKISKMGRPYLDDDADRYSPDREVLLRLFQEAEESWRRNQSSSSAAQIS